MEPITTFTGTIVALPINDIDTDQIIPARYLKVTDKNRAGRGLFSDWRYNADGSPKPDFMLNQPEYQGAQSSGRRATTSAAAVRASTRPGR